MFSDQNFRSPQNHHTRNLPVHSCRQIDICVSLTSQVWWGYANADDHARLEGFLRRCVRLSFRSASSPTLASICDVADDVLFTCINDSRHLMHLLRPVLPPTRDDHYKLRKRHHNLHLPAKTSTLSDNGFFKRTLYKNTGCDRSASVTINFYPSMLVELHHYLFLTCVLQWFVCLY